MSNVWTKIGVSATTLLAGLALATAAVAAEASNSNTGADSDNDATVEVSHDTTKSIIQNTRLTNNFSISANTGDNSADENTGDGSVNTGDINGSVSIENTGNQVGENDTTVDFSCNGDCHFSASNSNTGADSDNDASVSVHNDVDITIENDADVENNVEADLNTGGNSADENTGDGSVNTGDINFDIEIVNDLNKVGIGDPVDSQEPKGPGLIPQPRIKPEGQVLAASDVLPSTGGNPLSWPLALLLAGLVFKLAERISRKSLAEA